MKTMQDAMMVTHGRRLPYRAIAQLSAGAGCLAAGVNPLEEAV
ncbi:MAG: hypothetical protein O7G88_13190 [bacterium]|nr:hypothetical protein [bacterium]